MIFSLLDYRIFRGVAPLIYAGSVFLLIAVLFVGVTIGGARRWFDVKLTLFQPSEAAKIGMILALAAFISSRDAKMAKLVQFPDRTRYHDRSGASDLPAAGPRHRTRLHRDLGGDDGYFPTRLIYFVGIDRWRRACRDLALGAATRVSENSVRCLSRSELAERIFSGEGYNILQAQLSISSGGVTGNGIRGSYPERGRLSEGSHDRLYLRPCGGDFRLHRMPRAHPLVHDADLAVRQSRDDRRGLVRSVDRDGRNGAITLPSDRQYRHECPDDARHWCAAPVYLVWRNPTLDSTRRTRVDAEHSHAPPEICHWLKDHIGIKTDFGYSLPAPRSRLTFRSPSVNHDTMMSGSRSATAFYQWNWEEHGGGTDARRGATCRGARLSALLTGGIGAICAANSTASSSIINQLQEMDTAAIPPTAQVIAANECIAGRYSALPSLPTEAALTNVPREEDKFIEVDAVLEEA